MLDVARWVFGGLCFCLFVWVAVGNIVIILRNYLQGGKSSLILLVGGLFGAGGLIIIPWAQFRGWWWAPLLLDIGCGPAMGLSAIQAITSRHRPDE